MSEEILSPKVSIILPTYNRAGLILETIESIRHQTYTNWELIIVDDGSEDNTEELVNRVNDERIQFHKAGRIGIGGKIKNIGLELSSGELIAFIDSDDLWQETKLEKQVAALQQNAEAGFCVTNGYNFKTPGEPVQYFYKQKEGSRVDDLFTSYFKSGLAGFTQALMIKKECVQERGGFKETNSFSDADFIAKLASHFKGIILYEPLIYRRLHDTNYIHSTWEKSYHEGIGIIQTYKDKLPAKVRKDAFFRLYVNFGEKCLVYKKNKKAINCFLKAWKYKPLSIVPLKKIAKSVLYSFGK